MRFSAVFATLLTASVAYAASPVSEASLTSQLSLSLTKDNHYGAPIPPWQKGCKPGWYYGDHPHDLDQVLFWLKDTLICKILELLPLGFHCPPSSPPPPVDPWTPIFTNYTCAVQADDYQTYGLVDTIDDCKTMCTNVVGCIFFNTYHDNNAKDGSTQLTCALYSSCHDEDDADHCGGQTEPDGSVSFITESAGYCFDSCKK